MKESSEKKKGAKTAFIVSIIIFAVLLVACFVYLYAFTPLFRSRGDGEATGTVPPITSVDVTSGDDTSAPDVVLPDNPVDFEAQRQINDDIYAWISIPGTNVDYPILQSKVDDLFYLRRGLDKKYSVAGVLFTESHNSLDFTDPVTVVYGHDMRGYGDDMFADLHYFENAEFFRDNEYFTICIPGHVLTYRIVSAYKYDDRHIMNSFNFDDPDVVREYFDYVMHPAMIPMNVREGATLADGDKLVVLSTCMSDTSYRFLVNGVLIDDQPTK